MNGLFIHYVIALIALHFTVFIKKKGALKPPPQT